MKKLVFSFEGARVSSETIHGFTQKLQPTIKELNEITKSGGYDSEYASINLVSDKVAAQKCVHLANQFKDIEAMVVIGIGGSNLGTLAVHEALNGKLYNALHTPRVFFADTVDPDSVKTIAELLDAYGKAKKRTLLVFVTKSGTTSETVANFEVFYEIIKKHREHPNKDVVAITDKGSPLWQLADFNDWAKLEVPKNVGGRYSVFSAVGIFPLAVLGVDVHALLQGAHDALENNDAMHSATIRYHHYIAGRNIHDLFLFATDLESVGKWWRQLVGESLGKEYNRDGSKRILNGITPTVSIGSTDLHSAGQLFLGGPQDKYLTLVHYAHSNEIAVPNMPEFEKLVPHIQKKQLHEIMQAIFSGFSKACEEHERPYCTITLKEKSAYYIGQLLQTLMIETIYLAALMDVNAFDQPNVESYKKVTKEILRKC